MCCVVQGEVEPIQILLASGAWVSKDKWGRSPVQLAEAMGHTEAVYMLLQAPAKPVNPEAIIAGVAAAAGMCVGVAGWQNG